MKLKFTILIPILFLFLSGYGNEPATFARNPLSDNEKELLLNLVNEARSKGCRCGSQKMPPAGPVEWNEQLEKAAEKHSQDMARHRFMGHDGSDGSAFSARITKAGFKWASCAENIAEGYETVEKVVDGWLNSPSHCKNLMDPRSKFMGVARDGTFWTQDFGGK
jgi:uncharacterized protein YkwD